MPIRESTGTSTSRRILVRTDRRRHLIYSASGVMETGNDFATKEIHISPRSSERSRIGPSAWGVPVIRIAL